MLGKSISYSQAAVKLKHELPQIKSSMQIGRGNRYTPEEKKSNRELEQSSMQIGRRNRYTPEEMKSNGEVEQSSTTDSDENYDCTSMDRSSYVLCEKEVPSTSEDQKSMYRRKRKCATKRQKISTDRSTYDFCYKPKKLLNPFTYPAEREMLRNNDSQQMYFNFQMPPPPPIKAIENNNDIRSNSMNDQSCCKLISLALQPYLKDKYKTMCFILLFVLTLLILKILLSNCMTKPKPPEIKNESLLKMIIDALGKTLQEISLAANNMPIEK